MRFVVIIPARYASSRLPGKVLLDIAGKSMLQRVFDNARASDAVDVVVATDDTRVENAARDFGATVVMTSSEHRSGTERLAEATGQLGLGADDIVVNVQADEPLMPGALMRQVALGLAQNPTCSIATLCEPIDEESMLFDPNAVKVVCDQHQRALYFSRAPVPWVRDAFAAGNRTPTGLHFRHIGLYAYRVAYLQEYAVRTPCALELAESLEQLRALDAGDQIHVGVAERDPGPGVDTADDLARARALAVAL
jgi:3-deoxy-manno-octulosonate cytidylyltransferase (CMP-KDO synthetase)